MEGKRASFLVYQPVSPDKKRREQPASGDRELNKFSKICWMNRDLVQAREAMAGPR